MKLLAIETATERCSAALLIGDEIIEKSKVAPRRHNELILDFCEEILAQGEMSLDELDAIAFGRGPGAFTGVRLAASITQGIAIARELPVVSVSTLAAIAQAKLNKSKQVLTCIDARMQEIYVGLYECADNQIMQLIGAEQVIKPKDLNIQTDKDCYGTGSGWKEYAEVIQKSLGRTFVYDQEALPHAREVAQIAKEYFKNGNYVHAHEALPVYLRDNVAQKKAT